MSGICASTGSDKTIVTSSCDLKLASRYSRNAASANPTINPPTTPIKLIRTRFGLNGFSAGRAESRILNCSPICRRSRLAAIFDSSFFASRSGVHLLQRLVIARQLGQLCLTCRHGLDSRLISGGELAQPLLFGALVGDLPIEALELELQRPLAIPLQHLAGRRGCGRLRRQRRGERLGLGPLLEAGDSPLQADDIGMLGRQPKLQLGEVFLRGRKLHADRLIRVVARLAAAAAIA